MKRHIFGRKLIPILTGCLLTAATLTAGSSQDALPLIPTVYVDDHGIMRWSDSHQEASFFGVNYTVPFAHAYRALGERGIDRKKAIDRDVYHFARLGLNAYRIHLWDVEITDGEGHLLENDHLDLLDYLIYKLRERGIYTFITAQTNFGNGYPEHNKPTGGYSYLYDKCAIHRDPRAIEAQATYLTALVNHINPYTGHAYKDDPSIVGFEINNEPCHTGSVEETEAYINRMLSALRKAGNRKPIFYNVSHNGEVVEAYYHTAIQGTTYQWYPTGLVSGHTRHGNFLPYVERYDIPFSTLRNFEKKARMVYEFDPADILYSYMYPATVRAFRSAGFQWITQFAYDPIDMADCNTEYQTHYLNVAYTPHKAIGLLIAAEVARGVPRGAVFDPYPADTLFQDFRVSYTQDLSELNDGKRFYYSNTTQTLPKEASRLQAIAGCGSSPVVRYEGTGAYWLDRLEAGVWRLEVMPDVIQMSDPFEKPAPDKAVTRILPNAWDMTLDIPDLGKNFRVTGLNEGNTYLSSTTDGTISSLRPGVYLLRPEGRAISETWNAQTPWHSILLGEYVQPAADTADFYAITHIPFTSAEAGRPLLIEAVVAGPDMPDSVIIYTDKVSFWNDYNPSIRMERTQGYHYQAIIPAEEAQEGILRYTIVVFHQDKRQTFPSGSHKSPLDWDYTDTEQAETKVVSSEAPLTLFEVSDASSLEAYTLPEWSRADRQLIENGPTEKNTLRITFESKEAHPVYFLRRAIRDAVSGRSESLADSQTLCLHLNQIPTGVRIGFITASGHTYLASCPPPTEEGIVRISLSDLQQSDTALLPYAYPAFLEKFYHPLVDLPFRKEEIETLELRVAGISGQESVVEIGRVWLER